ncbi:putative C-type lectin domain family 20 member A [Clarias gariepinus]|uniref:putative C-type lectin domain family 20 member A n=1 Tax=Clarias gariepinus TaxID=13013 RepID=UPI00234C6A5D|nr:putative C-type lectin domain family 20 member A [Clarias gariepinus]
MGMSWYNAQIYCRTHHTDLASSNATENPILLELINGTTGAIWFGLFRDSWKWIDQTNFTTFPISWMLKKPDNALGKENCGYLDNSQVADAQCSDIMPFFCYSAITGKQQIMEVMVQSNQDLNDPAIKTAILEQIQLKLMNHGKAEDIKVNWKKQPDGQVFDKKKAKDGTEKGEL